MGGHRAGWPPPWIFRGGGGGGVGINPALCGINPGEDRRLHECMISVCLYVQESACLLVCLSARVLVCWSARLLACVSVNICVYLCVSVSLSLPVCLVFVVAAPS